MFVGYAANNLLFFYPKPNTRKQMHPLTHTDQMQWWNSTTIATQTSERFVDEEYSWKREKISTNITSPVTFPLQSFEKYFAQPMI